MLSSVAVKMQNPVKILLITGFKCMLLLLELIVNRWSGDQSIVAFANNYINLISEVILTSSLMDLMHGGVMNTFFFRLVLGFTITLLLESLAYSTNTPKQDNPVTFVGPSVKASFTNRLVEDKAYSLLGKQVPKISVLVERMAGNSLKSSFKSFG